MMEVTANGKTFSFPEGTSTDDVGAAIDEYFASSAQQSQTEQAQPQQQDSGFMGDIAEGFKEAGRGAVQGATNLINTLPALADIGAAGVAQAGSLLGVGDGSYSPAPRLELPQELKPTSTEGKVFSEALPFLVNPAGGAGRVATTAVSKISQGAARLAGENLVGTLASNSENTSPEKVATDLAMNVALGGVVKGAGELIGTGYRAAKGTIAPEAQQAIRFAEQNNAPLLTTDVVNPGTFAGRSAQALGEKIPLTGTGSVRRGQQESRKKLIDGYAEKFTPPAPDEIVQSLQRQTSKVKQAAGSRMTQVNDGMKSVGKIQPTGAINSIDTEIARLSRLGGAADSQTISKLQTYRDELAGGADFELLRDLRTQFRQDVKGDRMAWPNQSEAAVSRVYSALTNDINNSVSSNLGNQMASRYKQANAVYANEARLVNNTRLKNVLQKGELTPEIVNNLLFSNKPSEVRQLYSSLDTKGKSAARSAVIGKAYEKAGGSPDKFINEINRLGSQTGVIFKGADRKYLDGLTTYLDQTRRAAKAGAVTPTGQELLQVSIPAGLFIGGTPALASGLGYGVLARIYESKPVRNAMLRLANTPKGSSAFERNLKEVERHVNAALQGAKSEVIE
ncbi:lytic transglycosylase domain-containing protein [Yersinia sp. 2544 StPb PI]|uniref:lytic transglycosylase domain-containing protein n=1 Tax=Yersinia sp. 2544 StPb PI TaxID=3117409 RepID=UPI003B27F3FA